MSNSRTFKIRFATWHLFALVTAAGLIIETCRRIPLSNLNQLSIDEYLVLARLVLVVGVASLPMAILSILIYLYSRGHESLESGQGHRLFRTMEICLMIAVFGAAAVVVAVLLHYG